MVPEPASARPEAARSRRVGRDTRQRPWSRSRSSPRPVRSATASGSSGPCRGCASPGGSSRPRHRRYPPAGQHINGGNLFRGVDRVPLRHQAHPGRDLERGRGGRGCGHRHDRVEGLGVPVPRRTTVGRWASIGRWECSANHSDSRPRPSIIRPSRSGAGASTLGNIATPTSCCSTLPSGISQPRTTVNREGHPEYEAGGGAAQPQYGRGDLRGGRATHRLVAHGFLHRPRLVLDHVRRHRRSDHAWADGVDPDAPAGRNPSRHSSSDRSRRAWSRARSPGPPVRPNRLGRSS